MTDLYVFYLHARMNAGYWLWRKLDNLMWRIETLRDAVGCCGDEAADELTNYDYWAK